MRKIYVVEDNRDISELIHYLLADAGFAVTIITDLTDFRQTMAIALPDLIILDIMLPDGYGDQACLELKTDVRTRHIPILLISAHFNGSSMAEKALADAFVSKPFDINAFTDRVQQLVAL